MGLELKDIDRGWKKVRKVAKSVAESHRGVTVGVHADKAARSDGKDARGHATNVMIAAVMEFGSPSRGIPERSVVRATVAEHGAEYSKMCGEELRDVILGEKTVETALARVGLKVKSDMIRRIDQGVPPPLKPETIRRKGSSKPWIDTGAVKQAFDFEVER